MSAWADQVESEEATNGALANNSDFPTLGEATKQQPKSKAKKGMKLGLGEFMNMTSGSRPEFADKSLQDKQILLSLPTASRGGPREDGDGRQLGGGFRDYSGDREGRGGRFQRDDRPQREEREPSRADSVDDWGSTRKFVPGGDGGGGGFGGSRGFGGGGFSDRGDRPPREARPLTNADLADDWGSSRKFEPSGASGPRGGFDDRRGPERRFDGPPPLSKADMEDSWGRGRDFKSSEAAPQSRGFSGSREGPRETSDREERWGRRGPDPSPSEAPEGPTERPRLKLAPRSVLVGDQVTSSSTGGAAGPEERKPSLNPFGAARPREEVLREKGVDPIKEALKLEHGEIIRDESAAEKDLKAEVQALTKQLKAATANGGEVPDGGPSIVELEQQLDAKERALLKLQAEEDDKVRFARGSRAGAEVGKERLQRNDGDGAGKDSGAPPPRRERW